MVRIAVLLALLQPASEPEEAVEVEAGELDPVDAGTDAENPSPGEAPQEEPKTADPFQKATVPGFPDDVDLNDESTWSKLEPEEKDKLREIRAGIRAKEMAYAPTPDQETETEVKDGERAPVLDRPRERGRHANLDWWEQRDRQLVSTTVGFGVTWGISLAVTGILLAAMLQNADDCDEASNSLMQTDIDRCSQGARQTMNLAAPTYIFGSIAGVSMIGTIVSGSLLGGHRNSKGFISLSPRTIGLSLEGRF